MAPVTWRAEQILEMAVGAVKAGEFERAAALCVNAIKIKPEFAEAFHIRGICLLKLQRAFDALMCFDRSLNIKEDQSDCWNNRGIAMAEVGLFDAARASFQLSLSLSQTVEPHVMCGGMFAHLMKLEAAEKEFRAAIEIEPTLQDAHLKLGVVLLGQGAWLEGWQEYQWRWFDTPFPPRPFRLFKKWAGESLFDKTILLYSEQGFGDEIMSLRYVDEVAAQAKRAILEVRPSMVRVAQASNFGAANPHAVIVMAHGDPYNCEIDYSSPLLDVPMCMSWGDPFAGRQTRRLNAAYLDVRPDRDKWDRMLPNNGKPNVGLCWSSGRRPLQPETEKSAAAKSIPVELLRPLFDAPVNFVSLQIPRERLPQDMPALDLTEHIDDFYDTAQLIRSLDLVVSVDTAVAHLAGALGKRCLTLVRFNGYWPWMEPRLDDVQKLAPHLGEVTPWYPSMRLYRQPELGYWDPAIENVREALVRNA